MARRHDATGIGFDRPALSVRRPDAGCRKRAPVDNHLAGDLDVVARKCCHSLDERCETAGAEAPTEIAALACLLEGRSGRRADEHQISNCGGTIKLLDAPDPERLARREVQPIATDQSGRRAGNDN